MPRSTECVSSTVWVMLGWHGLNAERLKRSLNREDGDLPKLAKQHEWWLSSTMSHSKPNCRQWCHIQIEHARTTTKTMRFVCDRRIKLFSSLAALGILGLVFMHKGHIVLLCTKGIPGVLENSHPSEHIDHIHKLSQPNVRNQKKSAREQEATQILSLPSAAVLRAVAVFHRCRVNFEANS